MKKSPIAAMRLLLVLTTALAAGCQATLPPRAALDSAKAEHPIYTLGPGDKLRLIVYEYESLSGTFSVDDTGMVALPLAGRIDVKGLTIAEFEKLVTKHFVDSQINDPKVSAELMELRPFCVLGEVRNPGCFSYVYGLTVSQAIAYAGGYSYRAKKNALVVTRADGRKVLGEHDTPIFVGDVIEVFERYF